MKYPPAAGAAPEALARALLRRPQQHREEPPMKQGELPLIPHEVEDRLIHQRASDGYINATAMCQATGKAFADYGRLSTTKAFLQALHADMGIPMSELIQMVRGGFSELQGTWVHPQVAIHLAQWLSPAFSVQVSKWVFEWLSGQAAQRSAIPDHVRRYIINQPKIPVTHFSMLNQMFLRLLAPLENRGYILPANLMPDIALGKMFSKWLRRRGFNPDSFPTYQHRFLDHRPIVEARLYPNELMTDFNVQLDRWIRDGRARLYFKTRDGEALPALDQVLAALPPPSPSGEDGDQWQ